MITSSYVKLIPIQQAQFVSQIAKHVLANGNKTTILRYTKEFQTIIKMSYIDQHMEGKRRIFSHFTHGTKHQRSHLIIRHV